MKFTPFANESAALELPAGAPAESRLKFENHLDQVAVYGNVNLTADKRGLELALALKDVIGQVVTHLQALDAQGRLPAAIEPPKAPERVPNPLA